VKAIPIGIAPSHEQIFFAAPFPEDSVVETPEAGVAIG
jgi:hypothetical protein